MIARWLPGPRHLVVLDAAGRPRLYVGTAPDARTAVDSRPDIAPEYGVGPHQIGVRLTAPRKGVPSA